MTNSAYSAKHIRRMKLFERQFLKPVFDALHKQIKPVVNTMRSKGIEAAQASLDTVEINAALAPPIKDIYSTVGLYFANKTIWDLQQSANRVAIVSEEGQELDINRFKAGGIITDPRPYIIGESKASFGFNADFLREILSYFNRYLLNQVILPISETTKNQILQVISEGVEKGWGADKIADALESPELLLWRARLIVRTESNKAMNYGQRIGEAKSDWETDKTWIAANDHRTRHSHRNVDDVKIKFNEKFLVPVYKNKLQIGYDLMDGPGDNKASAGNICNCRCTLAFSARRDENGRLIRKNSSVLV